MRVYAGAEDGVLQAVAQLKEADDGLQAAMMADAREQLGDAWRQLLNEQIDGRQDADTIVDGSRVIVGSDGFIIYAAESVQPLSGGLIPRENWHAVEFGARTRRVSVGDRSPATGRAYRANKMINRGLPSRQKYGRVAFRAASLMGRELVRVWVTALVERYRKAANDG